MQSFTFVLSSVSSCREGASEISILTITVIFTGCFSFPVAPQTGVRNTVGTRLPIEVAEFKLETHKSDFSFLFFLRLFSLFLMNIKAAPFAYYSKITSNFQTICELSPLKSWVTDRQTSHNTTPETCIRYGESWHTNKIYDNYMKSSKYTSSLKLERIFGNAEVTSVPAFAVPHCRESGERIKTNEDE